jgi:hypothetical protein
MLYSLILMWSYKLKFLESSIPQTELDEKKNTKDTPRMLFINSNPIQVEMEDFTQERNLEGIKLQNSVLVTS